VVSTLADARPAAGEPRSTRVLRLGAVSYLNVEPIIHGLDRDPRFKLIREVPSRVAWRLHAGEIDLGTIPSIEYAFGDYAIVPGIAIGSRGSVGSVSLYHQVPLPSIQKVALDTSSRTSVALLKVLLRERLGRDPDYVEMDPSLEGMLNKADAALLIGDPALYLETTVPRLDLGEEWHRATGLPFVYAFWAGRPGVVDVGGVRALQEALAGGRGAVREIASAYADRVAGEEGLNERYLTARIQFDLGEAEQAGLTEFYRRCHAQGLIPRVPALRFHADR
jgi:chorismate dehydratase